MGFKYIITQVSKIVTTIICLFILVGLFSFISHNYENNHYSKEDNNIVKAIEYGYYLGQKDAINGDIKIELHENDEEWDWVASPWGNNSNRKILTSYTE